MGLKKKYLALFATLGLSLIAFLVTTLVPSTTVTSNAFQSLTYDPTAWTSDGNRYYSVVNFVDMHNSVETRWCYIHNALEVKGTHEGYCGFADHGGNGQLYYYGRPFTDIYNGIYYYNGTKIQNRWVRMGRTHINRNDGTYSYYLWIVNGTPNFAGALTNRACIYNGRLYFKGSPYTGYVQSGDRLLEFWIGYLVVKDTSPMPKLTVNNKGE